MLTAHLPSGYCLVKGLSKKLSKGSELTGWAFFAAVLGAVFPDFDMLFFYFVDDRSIHHHRYWVHVPAFWLVVSAIVLPVLWRTTYKTVALWFLAGVLLHLLLDSIGGGIMWLAPFNDHLFELMTVPASQSHWILSFILHWTFVLEMLIWGTAIYLYIKARSDTVKAND